jgi:hypothetical protein
MEKGIKYSDISEDLLRLYGKVRHAAIEDMFIKVSQTHGVNVSKWITTHSNIKNYLNNPSVYGALETLVYLTSKVGDTPSLSNMITALTPSPKHLAHLPIIMAFGELIGKEDLDILIPFRFIIVSLFTHFKIPEGQEVEDTQEILTDLITIQEKFSKASDKAREEDGTTLEKARIRKPSLTKQREEIFVGLFKSFSKDLANASEAAGLTEIAQKFRDGILGIPPPIGIGEYIELDPISDAQMREAKRMADYVFKYPAMKNMAYLHDLVEVQLLQQAGAITAEDVYRFKEGYEKQRSILNYFNEDDAGDKAGLDIEDKIPSDMRLNPDYIYMLSVFFMFLQQKLRIPPSGIVMI